MIKLPAPTDTIPDAARDVILSGIRAHNEGLLGPSDRQDLFIPITIDQDGDVEGGLIGYTGRGWLHVELLLVPERLRGRGLAGELLQIAEEEAKARGCIGAYIDTLNTDARKAYERAGYQVFGTLDGFTGRVPGQQVPAFWMIKRF